MMTMDRPMNASNGIKVPLEASFPAYSSAIRPSAGILSTRSLKPWASTFQGK